MTIPIIRRMIRISWKEALLQGGDFTAAAPRMAYGPHGIEQWAAYEGIGYWAAYGG